MEAARKRAQQMACRLTDPSTKKKTFYCTIRRLAKRLGSEFGIVLELRKPTLSKWVEEYLYSVFVRELPVKDEKALINYFTSLKNIYLIFLLKFNILILMLAKICLMLYIIFLLIGMDGVNLLLNIKLMF